MSEQIVVETSEPRTSQTMRMLTVVSASFLLAAVGIGLWFRRPGWLHP